MNYIFKYVKKKVGGPAELGRLGEITVVAIVPTTIHRSR
jgi:hypothetical protein